MEESIVGLVLIEGPDHVIAIATGVGLGRIALVTVGLGVANQVEPVPAPGLSIMGGGEQSNDQPLVSIRSKIGDERVETSSGDGGRPVRS